MAQVLRDRSVARTHFMFDRFDAVEMGGGGGDRSRPRRRLEEAAYSVPTVQRTGALQGQE